MKSPTTDHILESLFANLETEDPNFKTLYNYKSRFKSGTLTDKHKETIIVKYTSWRPRKIWVKEGSER